MAWFILLVAGLFEIGWGTCLKASEGFTRLWPSVAFLVFTIASLVLLGISLRVLPLGTAYAVWTGVGAVGMVIVGMVWFGEPFDWRRLACVGLIIAGIVGLRLVTPDPDPDPNLHAASPPAPGSSPAPSAPTSSA